mgnify:FL=1
MIEISQIKLPCGSDPSLLEGKIRKLLRLSREEHFRFELSHHSVDARKKPVLYDVYSVRVELFSKEKENKLIQKLSGGASHVRPVTEKAYSFPLSLANQYCWFFPKSVCSRFVQLTSSDR